MAGIFQEFQRHLASLRQRYSGNPRKEIRRLFMLALEREELVSIGYRESVMARRLQEMPIEDDIRNVIRHALVWIWKDEEMHSLYIRGAILRVGSRRLKAQAFLTQLAGGLAGWASSVLQHSRWRDAPMSRSVAHLVRFFGSLLGKVPEDVKEHLRRGPFRNFCRFNVDAEKTAWACWSRIVELAGEVEGMSAQMASDFRRVVDDEHRHEKVFQILVDALDDRDCLVEGLDAGQLTERIREVGEHFLPRACRGVSPADNPLGTGGRVYCRRGRTRGEREGLFHELLGDCGLGDSIRRRAELLKKPFEDMRVAVKPTFMLGYDRRDRSPVTDPRLIESLAAYLGEIGCGEVSVVEGRNIYDRFYQNRSVLQVAAYFGLTSPHYRVVDASEEQVPHEYSRGMAQYTVSRTWKEADFRISFAKVRSHPIELALLTVGNVEWVGARCDEFLFVERQANRATAVMMLLDDFPPHFALLDGFEDVPDGLVGVMGCRRPKSPLRLYAGADALAVDTVAGRHLGIQDPRDSSLLLSACHWFGGWSEGIEVVGCDDPVEGWRGPYSNELWAILSFLAYPVYVLGSGRGSLFVPEMDQAAFPAIRQEGALLRLGRRIVRRLIGLSPGQGR